MFPILFQIGSLQVFSSGVFTALGFLFGVITFVRLAHREKCHLELISDHFILLLFVSLIGARLAYVFAFWEGYSWNFMKIFYFWENAYFLWGGILFFMIAFIWLCSRTRENVHRWIDIVIPSLAVGLLFHNLAQLLDGVAYGAPTDRFWGIIFETTTVPYAIPVHPTQIYLIVLLLILLFVLLPLLRKKSAEVPGSKGWIGLMLLALSYFGVEFFRGDELVMFYSIRWTQVLELATLLLGIVMYFRRQSNLRS